jgi:hypothetical protein
VEKVVMEESITTATWVSIVPPKECLAMPSAAGDEVTNISRDFKEGGNYLYYPKRVR